MPYYDQSHRHMNRFFLFLLLSFILGCQPTPQPKEVKESPHFTWDNATVYFMMTDRFYDGDPSNNYQHTQDDQPAPYRGYMGGDIKGITQKVKEGYFTDLGVNALWMTPLVEQIKGSVDEGTGTSFGFHGYWTRDWTALDIKFGTKEDLKELIKEAHLRGIRVLLDVVANHTGPVTPLDSQWPDEWVKTGPRCTYVSAETTINCTLVENLPDIKTESDVEVTLPEFLVDKWKSEGRYDREISELNDWFTTTGYKRTAVNYILKWIVDFIKEYGVDGFRIDTVKHTEAAVWDDLWQQAYLAYANYKKEHSDPVLDDDNDFYMVGEVYNYYISGGRDYNYGDEVVDFYDSGFKSLINFDFKSDAHNGYEQIFSKYDSLLHGPLKGKSILNYVSSHDDGGPFDKERKRTIESGTKLLLCPGGVQIYYGDETGRSLSVEADGDAVLRSFMNWDELNAGADINGISTQDILRHWQKIGSFRRDNPAVGAGRHQMVTEEPYVFKRTYNHGSKTNKVIVGLDLPKGQKKIRVGDTFADKAKIRDTYGEVGAVVENGYITIDTPYDIALIEQVDE